jgi:RNA polymerase sigma factor (sigma-70 family)
MDEMARPPSIKDLDRKQKEQWEPKSLLAAYVWEDDIEAIEIFFRWAKDFLWSFLSRLSYTRECSPEDREDLISLVVVRVLASRHGEGRYRWPEAVEPWLRTIARNAVTDEFRRRERAPKTKEVRPPEADEAPDEQLEAIPDDSPSADPEREAIRKLTVEALRQAIRSKVNFTTRQRAVIMMTYYENFSQAEIARRLGISEVAVHRLLERAR